jgi:hypothetical protein
VHRNSARVYQHSHNVGSVARQRLGKHVPAAMNTHKTVEELLYNMYPLQFGPCHIKGKQANSSSQNFFLIYLFNVYYFHYPRFCWSDSSVGIITNLVPGLTKNRVRSPPKAENSLIACVQTGSGSHFSLPAGSCFPGIQQRPDERVFACSISDPAPAPWTLSE